MSDIEYVRHYGLSLAQARKIAQKAADDLAKEYDLVCEWVADTLRFRRSGVEGQMEVSAVQLKLEVHLRFPLSLLKATFEANIKKYIDERLDEAKPAVKAAATKSPAKNAPAKKLARKTGKA